jgi:HlyD family secretion protein
MTMLFTRTLAAPAIFLIATALTACREKPPADRIRVSGQIEATDVQVSAQVGGRVVTLNAAEGQRVAVNSVIAVLDTADAALALARATAERDQAEAQLRLLRAGARNEDIKQAEAQVASADAEVAALAADLAAAVLDVERFERLLASNSGSRKQRDDAVARRNVARERVRAARERSQAATETVHRLRAGARREEIEGATARVAATAAQIATLEKSVADATVTTPIAGVVTEKVVDPGELIAPRAPIVVVTDLDHVWANVYVGEPDVPRLKIGQRATLFTDAGGDGIPGTITYISDKAEFTPRNVQTADDRSKLVYRVKIAADNSRGTLKVGMPVEAEIPFGQ